MRAATIAVPGSRWQSVGLVHRFLQIAGGGVRERGRSFAANSTMARHGRAIPSVQSFCVTAGQGREGGVRLTYPTPTQNRGLARRTRGALIDLA